MFEETNSKYKSLNNVEIQTVYIFSAQNRMCVWGVGSQGTQVYRGYFESRPVAVKRIVKIKDDRQKETEKEVKTLINTDTHSNVVRYYARVASFIFLFRANAKLIYNFARGGGNS